MAKQKKKAPKRGNNIEKLMRDYARAILTGLAKAGYLDDDNAVKVIKASSDEFFDGCVKPLLDADVGAIIRLVRPPSSQATKLHVPQPGSHDGPPPPTTLGPVLGYIEEQQLFGADDEDFYEREIDF